MKYIILFLLFALNISAQTVLEKNTDLSITYQSSTLLYQGKSKVDIANYVLFKNEQTSYYMAESMFKIDSVKRLKKFNETDLKRFAMSQPNLIVKQKNVIEHYENIGNNFTYYQEEITLDWKLDSEQKKINNYLCNKATVSYGGRNWIAWYTTQIPISEGPYKFSGLPGLIVQMEDSESIFKFSLVSIESKKYTVSDNLASYFDYETSKIFNKISASEFYKFRDTFYKMSLGEKLKYINKGNSDFSGINIKNSDTGDKLNLNSQKLPAKNFIEKFSEN